MNDTFGLCEHIPPPGTGVDESTITHHFRVLCRVSRFLPKSGCICASSNDNFTINRRRRTARGWSDLGFVFFFLMEISARVLKHAVRIEVQV
jgi:hypothetical protein